MSSSTPAPLSFFWHDYETFGRVPRRDRPAQFAGLRTDAELQEIGEPVMIYCQPALDALPEPEACLLTGIVPQTCLEQGLPEPAFAARIERELAQPGTVGVGYNSLRFDDEVTRFLFWRNLIDPYAREWQNDCGRWDLLDVVRTAWALRPDGIVWPEGEDGRPSFKLEALTRANGLAHEAAHDALSDVRATVALARLLRQAQPRLWEHALRLRHKAEVLREIGVGRAFLHISGMYGTDRGCMALVWPLAPHPTNRNEIIVWDLSADPAPLFEASAQELRQRIFTRAADLPEGVERLPVKTVHINRSPMVIGNLRTLAPERAAHFGLDLELAARHAERLRDEGAKLLGVWAEVFRREAGPDAVDVDEDLYGGFVGPADRRQLERLRTAPPEELARRRSSFEDERLDELVFRYRARNFPETLNADERERWESHRRARLERGEGGALSLSAYGERLEALHETATDARAEGILDALIDWSERIAPV